MHDPAGTYALYMLHTEATCVGLGTRLFPGTTSHALAAWRALHSQQPVQLRCLQYQQQCVIVVHWCAAMEGVHGNAKDWCFGISPECIAVRQHIEVQQLPSRGCWGFDAGAQYTHAGTCWNSLPAVMLYICRSSLRFPVHRRGFQWRRWNLRVLLRKRCEYAMADKHK
jgi:hypothetical protein